MTIIRSMTAFGKAEFNNSAFSLSWELKTLNNRYLELNFKLPDAAKPYEGQLREQAKALLKRGKLETYLKLSFESAQQQSINTENLKVLTDHLDTVNAHYPGAGIPTSLSILNTPGILQDSQTVDIEEALISTFISAVHDLNDARAREGEQLKSLILQRVEEIEQASDQIAEQIPALQEKQHQRLVDKIKELDIDVHPERLEQELVILANKSDVAEEIDRLKTHCTEIRRILNKGGACGRRLDFMMQELNREANTLGSKAVGSEVTQTSVDLKVLIEQMREQIQNLE